MSCEAGKRLSLLLCDRREEPNSSPGGSRRCGWRPVPSRSAGDSQWGLAVPLSPPWLLPPPLSCGAPVEAQTPSEGRMPRWLLRTCQPGAGSRRNWAGLGWGGASGTPEALTGALGSEPRQAELPTVGRGGQTPP